MCCMLARASRAASLRTLVPGRCSSSSAGWLRGGSAAATLQTGSPSRRCTLWNGCAEQSRVRCPHCVAWSSCQNTHPSCRRRQNKFKVQHFFRSFEAPHPTPPPARIDGSITRGSSLRVSIQTTSSSPGNQSTNLAPRGRAVPTWSFQQICFDRLHHSLDAGPALRSETSPRVLQSSGGEARSQSLVHVTLQSHKVCSLLEKCGRAQNDHTNQAPHCYFKSIKSHGHSGSKSTERNAVICLSKNANANELF